MLRGCRACGARWHHGARACPSCLGPSEPVRAARRGTVIEHSEMGGEPFCAADFGGVRLICPVASGRPEVGLEVELVGDGTEVRVLSNPRDPGGLAGRQPDFCTGAARGRP